MHIPALSALLVAAAFSVVSAAPGKRETTERVSYTEEEPRAEPDGAWVELASPSPAKHGRQFITVDTEAGPFARLRIDAHAGKTKIHSVVVHYADGKERTIRVGKLVAKRKSAIVDLPAARPIEHVVVVTNPNTGGEYTLHAAPATSAVATR